MKSQIKKSIAKVKELINRRFTHKRIKMNQIQRLIDNKDFLKKLLDFSGNNIDAVCYYLGDIMVYYAISNDTKLDYSIEELLSKRRDVELYSIDDIKEKGFFTHSCSGNMIGMIKKNGLGSYLNENEELYTAISHLEQRLNTTGTYTKQQSGNKDEVYFTSPGATSFGYACNFAPERLFLGILRQEYDNSIPVRVGESKKDYYRKVIYQKIGKNITYDLMNDIETVIDGFFSDSNYIVSFKVDEVIKSENIFFEVVGKSTKINLEDRIRINCEYGNFFTSNTGSNSNVNNMDNLVMINTIIPPERLEILRVPDRYDFIQLIALNKGLHYGDKIDYFTLEKCENRVTSTNQKSEVIVSTQRLGNEALPEIFDISTTDKTQRVMSQQEKTIPANQNEKK